MATVLRQLPAVLADAAAELEARVVDKPGLSFLREVKDLEPAIVAALNQRFPNQVEKSRKIVIPQWSTAGNVDVVVRRQPKSEALALAAELKWSYTYDKIYESIWDLFKMALLSTRSDVDAAVLITGASPREWRSSFCADLFDEGVHSVSELCTRRFPSGTNRLAWDDLLEGGYDRFPTALPSAIATEVVAVQPVSRGDECWELRAVKVKPAKKAFVKFLEGWPVGNRPRDARRPPEASEAPNPA